MWNTVRVGSEDCFLNVTDAAGVYEFILSNLKDIWKKKLEEDEIVDIIHELNPQIEATPKVLVKKAISSLCEKNSDDNITCTEESLAITLKSVSTIGGFPFKFDLKLDLVPQKNVFHELTLPLLLMVQTLKEREEKVIGIIKLKDKEIEDYKLGGAQLSHKQLKTKPFDEKEYSNTTIDSKKINDVIQDPVKYFTSSLNEFFESTRKEITKHRDIEGSCDRVAVKFPQNSPDLFDESDEPEAKAMAVPKKMPTLLRVDLKPKMHRAKKMPKKIQI